MRTTPFTDIHLALGAKMCDFAGYYMPIEYSGIIDEHLTVCNGVGVFDVSHMGEFWVKGPNALAFLQEITANDVSVLGIGKAQYTYFPNATGGVVDDLLVYRYGEEKYMLVVNAANIEKDWEWCVTHNMVGAILENASEWMGQLAIQGPKATEVLQKLTSINLAQIPYYSFTQGEFAGMPQVIISNTGYTGAGGFELYFAPEQGAAIWEAIFTAGEEYGIKPIGLGARDTLRLEMGYCLYGQELTENRSPLEAGLGWVTKFVDQKPFIGREILEKEKEVGLKMKLVGIEMLERGIPRQGYLLCDEEEKPIGELTSGTQSPTRKVGIGLGYLPAKYAKLGTEVWVDVRGRKLKATVVKPPFRKGL